jgi:hypothetical protein
MKNFVREVSAIYLWLYFSYQIKVHLFVCLNVHSFNPQVQLSRFGRPNSLLIGLILCYSCFSLRSLKEPRLNVSLGFEFTPNALLLSEVLRYCAIISLTFTLEKSQARSQARSHLSLVVGSQNLFDFLVEVIG